jgi:hypothetical protein
MRQELFMLAAFRKRLDFKVVRAEASPSAELAFAFALRCCVILFVVGAAASAKADESEPVKILSGFRQPGQQPSAGNGSVDARDEADLPTRQLETFGTGSAVEPTSAAAFGVRNPEATTRNGIDQNTQDLPPLVMPGLVDRPYGIDDQNVAPIPTLPNKAIEGSSPESMTTTIPVVPDARDIVARPRLNNSASDQEPPSRKSDADSQLNIYDSAPRLLAPSDESPTSVVTQLLSTFLGVLLAVGLFLLVRVAAVKHFGVNLGVTFQLGAASKPSVQTISENEAADVVPFGVQSPQPEDSSQQSAPEHASVVADPADFRFRVIGSVNGDDDSASEGMLDRETEAGILKSVFEQNLNLMKTLDKKNESAA